MEQDKNIADKEFHRNVTYLSTSANLYQAEAEGIYDIPQDCNKANVNKNGAQANCFRTSIVIASIALILALLAASAIAVYFGIQGTVLANSSAQDYLQNISTLEQKVQILQARLSNQANRQNYLQNISTLEQKVQTLQAELNNQDDITTTLLARSVGGMWNPATSCSAISRWSPSGEYWIQTNGTSNPIQVYCDMNRTSCSCNAAGG